MASDLVAAASNLAALASNLVALASNLLAMASYLPPPVNYVLPLFWCFLACSSRRWEHLWPRRRIVCQPVSRQTREKLCVTGSTKGLDSSVPIHRSIGFISIHIPPTDLLG